MTCILRRVHRPRAGQRHDEAGAADGLRSVIGVKPVKGRLVQTVERALQLFDEVPLRQHQLVVLGPDGGGDLSRDGGLH
jgi:hypothetical protein